MSYKNKPKQITNNENKKSTTNCSNWSLAP